MYSRYNTKLIRWEIKKEKVTFIKIKKLTKVELMAIIAILTGKGFTKDMYERLRQEVKWETEPIDGWISHAVHFDKSGDIHIINIWESIEKLEEGFVSRLMPVMKKIGIPPPLGEVYPAYNVNIF